MSGVDNPPIKIWVISLSGINVSFLAARELGFIKRRNTPQNSFVPDDVFNRMPAFSFCKGMHVSFLPANAHGTPCFLKYHSSSYMVSPAFFFPIFKLC